MVCLVILNFSLEFIPVLPYIIVRGVTKEKMRGVIVDNTNYKPIDTNILNEKESIVVSSECALKDVIPINWDDKVVSGEKKVILVADGDS